MSNTDNDNGIPEGYIEQMHFDMLFRELMVRQAAEGPGTKIYFPTEAMRGWMRYHLHRWQSGEITEQEYVLELQEMLS